MSLLTLERKHSPKLVLFFRSCSTAVRRSILASILFLSRAFDEDLNVCLAAKNLPIDIDSLLCVRLARVLADYPLTRQTMTLSKRKWPSSQAMHSGGNMTGRCDVFFGVDNFRFGYYFLDQETCHVLF